MSLELMAALIGLVLSIIGWFIDSIKKGNKIKVARILKKVPDLIKTAEAENVPGRLKLATVLLFIQNECLRSHLKFNEEDWIFEVENILETPQKKSLEEVADESQVIS